MLPVDIVDLGSNVASRCSKVAIIDIVDLGSKDASRLVFQSCRRYSRQYCHRCMLLYIVDVVREGSVGYIVRTLLVRCSLTLYSVDLVD